MADDDEKTEHVFGISGGVCRGSGPVGENEISENMSNFSGALFETGRQLAAELFDREDVNYHAINVVVACRGNRPVGQVVAFSQGIPVKDAAQILAQTAGRLISDTEPDKWDEAAPLPPRGSSRLQ